MAASISIAPARMARLVAGDIGECQPVVERAGLGSMNEPPAADPKPIAHGGRLNEARRMFPGAPEPFLDLSTGINPVPYPLPNFAPDCFTRLPEPESEAALLSAAAAAYGAIDPSLLAAAPGTQILIDLLPRLWPAASVAVLGPTYAEHAHAWRKLGASVATVADIAALEGANVAVVCNPNNPDGRRIPRIDCWRWPIGCTRMAACWWWTRHSPILRTTASAWPGRCRIRRLSCCGRSARHTAWPGCGLGLRWQLQNGRCAFATRWDHGRCPGLRSPSAVSRWGIATGWKPPRHGWNAIDRGSMPYLR